MRKFLFSALLALVVCAPGLAQTRGPVDGNAHYGWADVLRVDPVYDSVRVQQPPQGCYQEHAPQPHGNTTASTVLGAVVGGVLGNTIGKGYGRKAATVAGAVAGGAVGNGAARRSQGEYGDSVTRCETGPSVSHQRRLVAYDVEYSYHGDIYLSRLNYDPGDRLRVKVQVSPAD